MFSPAVVLRKILALNLLLECDLEKKNQLYEQIDSDLSHVFPGKLVRAFLPVAEICHKEITSK